MTYHIPPTPHQISLEKKYFFFLSDFFVLIFICDQKCIFVISDPDQSAGLAKIFGFEGSIFQFE